MRTWRPNRDGLVQSALRIWRWRVEIHPVQNLLFYGALVASTLWLPTGAIRPVQAVLLAVIVAFTAVAVLVFASAWRQQRKARRL